MDEKKKWTVKDVITTVLLSAVLIVIQFVVNMVCMANDFVSMVLSVGMSSKNNSHSSSSRSVISFAGTYIRSTVIPMTMGRQGQNAHDQMKDSGVSSLFVGCVCSHDSKPSMIPPRSA